MKTLQYLVGAYTYTSQLRKTIHEISWFGYTAPSAKLAAAKKPKEKTQTKELEADDFMQTLTFEQSKQLAQLWAN
jgi:hypothetical protein